MNIIQSVFFEGLELVEPGLVFTPEWRPEELVSDPSRAAVYAGVGFKRAPDGTAARSG